MKTTILAVGKIKEDYLQKGIYEYVKRLSKFTKTEIIEVQDEKCPEKFSKSEVELVKAKEGERLLSKIPSGAYVIVTEINGLMLTSEELAQLIKDNLVKGKSHICFIIGGSQGIDKRVASSADCRLSFSKMTFPHQLMRLILLEQVYRSFKINNGEAYHK